MAALAADIAPRCVRLNPHLAGEAPGETRDAALIDDPDVRLHSNFQWAVARNLTSLPGTVPTVGSRLCNAACPARARFAASSGAAQGAASPADQAAQHADAVRRGVVVRGLPACSAEADLEAGFARHRRGHAPADPRGCENFSRHLTQRCASRSS